MKEHVPLAFSILIWIISEQKVHTKHIPENHNRLADENDIADTKDDVPDYIHKQVEIIKPIGYYREFKTVKARRGSDQDGDQIKDNVPVYIQKLPVEAVKSHTDATETKISDNEKSAVNFKKAEIFISSNSDVKKEKKTGYTKYVPGAMVQSNSIHSQESKIAEIRQGVDSGNDKPDNVQKRSVGSVKLNIHSTESQIDQIQENQTNDIDVKSGNTGDNDPDYIRKSPSEKVKKEFEVIGAQKGANGDSSNMKNSLLDLVKNDFVNNAEQEIIISTETENGGFDDQIQKPSTPNENEPKTVGLRKELDSVSGGSNDNVLEYTQKLTGATAKPDSISLASESGEIKRRTYDDSRSTDDDISDYLKKLPSQTGNNIVYSKKTKTLETLTDGNHGNGDTKDDLLYSLQKLPAETLKYSTNIMETGTDKTDDDSNSISSDITDSLKKNSSYRETSSIESEIASARKHANEESGFPNDVKDYINKLLTEKAKADAPAESGRVKKTYKVVITKTQRNKTINQPSKKFFRTHKVVENLNQDDDKNNYNVSVKKQRVPYEEPSSHTIVEHNYKKVTHNYNKKSDNIVNDEPRLLLLREKSREKSKPYSGNFVSHHEFVNEQSSNGDIYSHEINVAPQKTYTIKYKSKTKLKPNYLLQDLKQENFQYKPSSSKIEKALKVTNVHKVEERSSEENNEVSAQEVSQGFTGDELLKKLPPVPYKRLKGEDDKGSMIVVPLPYKPFGSFLGEDGKESMIFVPVSQKPNGNFKGKETLISHIRQYEDEDVHNPDIQFAKTYKLSEQLPQKRNENINNKSIKTTTVTTHIYKDDERDGDHSILISQPDANTKKESHTFSQFSYEPNLNKEKFLKTSTLSHHPYENKSEENVEKIKKVEFVSNKINISPEKEDEEDSLKVLPMDNNSQEIIREKDDERTLVSHIEGHEGEEVTKPVDQVHEVNTNELSLNKDFERINTDDVLKSHQNLKQEDENELHKVISLLHEPNQSLEDQKIRKYQTLYDSFKERNEPSQKSGPQKKKFLKEQVDSVTEDILFPRFVDSDEKKDIQLTHIIHKEDIGKETNISQFIKDIEKEDFQPQYQNEEVIGETTISQLPVDENEEDKTVVKPQNLELREKIAKIKPSDSPDNDKVVLISQLEKLSQQPVGEITDELLRPKTEDTEMIGQELSPQLLNIRNEELLFKNNKIDLSNKDERKGKGVEIHEVSQPEVKGEISEDNIEEKATARNFETDYKKPEQENYLQGEKDLENIISEVCSGVRNMNSAWDIIDKKIPLNAIHKPNDLINWKELYLFINDVLMSLKNLKNIPIVAILEEILQHTRYRILELLLSQLDENAYPYFRTWNDSININNLRINIEELVSIIEKHISDRWNYKNKLKIHSEDEWLPKKRTNVLREKLLVNFKEVSKGSLEPKHLSDIKIYQSQNGNEFHDKEFSSNPNDFDHEWSGWELKNELQYPLDNVSKQKQVMNIQDGINWETENNFPSEIEMKPERLTSVEWHEWNPKNNYKVHLENQPNQIVKVSTAENQPSTGWKKFESETEKVHPEENFYNDHYYQSYPESNKYKNENEIKVLREDLLLPIPNNVLPVSKWESVEKQNIHLENDKLKPDNQLSFSEINNWQLKNELFRDDSILKGERVVPLRNWNIWEPKNQLNLNSHEIVSNHKKPKNKIKIHLDATISDSDGHLHIPRWLRWQPKNKIEIQREEVSSKESSNQNELLPLPEMEICKTGNEIRRYSKQFISTSNDFLNIPDCSNLNAYKIGVNPEKTESAELIYLPDSYDHQFDLFHLPGWKETKQNNLKGFAANKEHASFSGFNKEPNIQEVSVRPIKIRLPPDWDNWNPESEVEIYSGDTLLKHNLIPSLQEGNKWELGMNPEENELNPGLLHHTEWNGWQPERNVYPDRYTLKSDDFLSIPIWAKQKSHYDIDIHPEISSNDDDFFYLPETKARHTENGLVHENILANPYTFSPSGWNEWQTESGLHMYSEQTSLKPNYELPLPECRECLSHNGIGSSLQIHHNNFNFIPLPEVNQYQNEKSLNIHQEEFATETNDFLTSSGWNRLRTDNNLRVYPKQTVLFDQVPLQMSEIADQVTLGNPRKPHPLRPLFSRILDIRSLNADVALLNLQNVFRQVLRHLERNDIPKEEVQQITSDMMKEVLNEMKQQIEKCRVTERYENLAKTLETMLNDYFYNEYNYKEDSTVSTTTVRQQSPKQGWWSLSPLNPQIWQLKNEIQVKR